MANSKKTDKKKTLDNRPTKKTHQQRKPQSVRFGVFGLGNKQYEHFNAVGKRLHKAMEALGAKALVSDPLYSDDELAALGLTPWDNEPIDAAIVQADHAEYAQLSAADLPGVRVVLDGREIIDAAAVAAAGVTVERIGRPSTTPPAS